ncbi:hypothetical protein NQ176_g2967 [Zarea fungicola]|uniref:Uncharacterized protein n=1 Tax=Zarea fungicola TaxID=93591 RepID=A0ACC1NKP0_9HYPO|nr:hypothetical protein NQ176_g2967 [Lecanicillium fungicola]
MYAAIFFAVARIGAIAVTLNNMFKPLEVKLALELSGCSVLFTSSLRGRALKTLLAESNRDIQVHLFNDTTSGIESCPISDANLADYERELVRIGKNVSPYMPCNLQFTSGSTGTPKIATLSSHNIVNNARFVAHRMNLTSSDILCCAPPMFHCFGLILGLLATIASGATIVYPSEMFEPRKTLVALEREGCTALHGTPTMVKSLLDACEASGLDSISVKVRKGIIAGAPVSPQLVQRTIARFGMSEFTSSYGLTEASPTCFNSFGDDPLEKRLYTAGKIMPHACAKIVDGHGQIVPVGQRGELCIAGYQVHAGYWNDRAKTNAAIYKDKEGLVWLRTGDEASFDQDGYCTITGRLKDIIVRGGENILPRDIEERLEQHEDISLAAVVGLADEHYGEVPAAFLKPSTPSSSQKPSPEQIRAWVGEYLVTGSGKIQKHILAQIGNKLVSKRRRAKI